MKLSEKILICINEGCTTSQICKDLKLNYKQLKGNIFSSILWKQLIDNTRKYEGCHLCQPDINSPRELFIDNIIYDIINNNLGFTEISLKLNIRRGYIRYISQQFDCYDYLMRNNQNYKTRNHKELCRIKHENLINQLLTEFGSVIRLKILSGANLQILKASCNLTAGQIKELVKILNLNELLKLNSKKILKENQLRRSLLGAEKVRGTKIIRHIVTNEMKQFYSQCIIDNLFEGESRNLFHVKFGTSGGNTWNFLIKEFGQIKKHPTVFLPGIDNKMFGKEPDWKSGNGIKGHIFINNKLIYFRSSLELRIYCYLYHHNIDFSLSNHVVKYFYNQRWRNYFQDIVIDDCIFEIKPSVKLNWKINELKFKALQEYCEKFNLKCKYLTESTFDLSLIDINYINEKIRQKLIVINENEYTRLLKYCKKW